jgi:hypothetical protein
MVKRLTRGAVPGKLGQCLSGSGDSNTETICEVMFPGRNRIDAGKPLEMAAFFQRQ